MKGYNPLRRPWMTFIQVKKDKSKFSCGGSIINNYWILSAGHCFCEKLKCKATKKGKLRIDYNPQDHIRIITGLKDHTCLEETFGFFRSPPTIYASYQSLEKMQHFDVIFEIFGRAVFEVAEVAEVKQPRNQKCQKFSNENL